MRRRDGPSTAEDLQWANAASLSREQLAEKMSAINAKTSAATMTASNFYLNDTREMIAKTSATTITKMISSSDRPRTAPRTSVPSPIDPAAPIDPVAPIDPFVAMARQMGVELHSPQQLMERRLVQERSKQAQRQQILRAQIEDALTPRKGSPAGSPSATGGYMHRAMHGRPASRMLHGSASSPGCVELQGSSLDTHESKPRHAPRAGVQASSIDSRLVGCVPRRASLVAAQEPQSPTALWPPPRSPTRRASLVASAPLLPQGSSCACAWGGAPDAALGTSLGRRNSVRHASLRGESPDAPPSRRAVLRPTGDPASDAAGCPRAADPGAHSGAESGADPGADLGADPGAADRQASCGGADTSLPQVGSNGNGSPAGAGGAAAVRLRSPGGAVGRRGSVPVGAVWEAAPQQLMQTLMAPTLLAPALPPGPSATLLPPALKSAGLVARCGRLALSRLDPMLRLVAPLLFREGRPPPPGGGALSRYTVELLLRALLPALPAPVLVDELMAVCAQPIPDKYARRPAAAAAVTSSGAPVALLGPLCCALAPLVQEAATPPLASALRQLAAPLMSPVEAAVAAATAATAKLGPGARFWFMLLDRDADGELGNNDLFYWLNAPAASSRPSIASASKASKAPPKGFASIAVAAAAAAAAAAPPPMQSLVESLVRVRRQEGGQQASQEASYECGQEGGSFGVGEVPCARVGLQAFTTAWVEHMDALPKPRPYAAALGWLRREMGEVDLGAVEAMKAPQHGQHVLARSSLPLRPAVAAEPPPACSGYPLGSAREPSPLRCRREAAVVLLCQHNAADPTPYLRCLWSFRICPPRS